MLVSSKGVSGVVVVGVSEGECREVPNSAPVTGYIFNSKFISVSDTLVSMDYTVVSTLIKTCYHTNTNMCEIGR